MTFILLINVKMPTIVGILTFINMTNATSERFKARHFLICRYFIVYEQLKFRAQLRSMKKNYNLGVWFGPENPELLVEISSAVADNSPGQDSWDLFLFVCLFDLILYVLSTIFQL